MDEDQSRLLRTAPFRDGSIHIECGSRGELGKPLPDTMELKFDALQEAFRASFGELDKKKTRKAKEAKKADDTETDDTPTNEKETD